MNELRKYINIETYRSLYINKEDEMWKLVVTYDELEDIREDLQERKWYYLNEECNTVIADEIRDLENLIYYCLHHDLEEE
jgi:hypothetical protein